jgi:hypothetical protein
MDQREPSYHSNDAGDNWYDGVDPNGQVPGPNCAYKNPNADDGERNDADLEQSASGSRRWSHSSAGQSAKQTVKNALQN